MSTLKNRFANIPLAVKVSVAYTVCSIIQHGIAFFTMPIFTRILTEEQFGQYTVYTSWSTIIAIFITLNLPYGSFSTAMMKFEDNRDGYISVTQSICLILCAVFLAIYLPFAQLWNRLFNLDTYVMCLMVAEILMTSAYMFWMGKKRFEFKYISVVVVTILMAILGPILAFVLVGVSEEKGIARIFGYAIVNIIIGLVLFVTNYIRGRKFFSKEMWKYAFEFNVPLIVYYLSQVVFNQSDRIMIDHYVGTDKAAIYGVAYNLSMLLSFVVNAINNSYVPWFYGKIKAHEERENATISFAIAGLMSVLILGIVAIAPELTWVMGGENYKEAIWIIPPVSISLLLLFYSQLFINVEFYYEKKGMLVWASVGAALVNIILNSLLIPKISYLAAGYTTLISYMVFVICNYITMKKCIDDSEFSMQAFNLRRLIVLFLIFLTLCFVCMLLYGLPGIRWGIIVAAIVIALFNYKRIMVFMRKYIIRKEKV